MAPPPPSPAHRLRQETVTWLQALPRRVRRRLASARPVGERFTLTSAAGYRVAGMLYVPQGAGVPERVPGVLLTPGTNDPGAVFEGWTQPINARELCAQGYAVAWFDPAGRGESWGAEDYGGLEHQDDVRLVLRHLLEHPRVDPSRSGVLSISLGIAMACGALARHRAELPVSWLLDWEGPCDREVICAGGRIMAPALGHGLADEPYWQPREAVRHVGALGCRYVRFQSEVDHAQPGELRHATRMIQAAAHGSLPAFRLNDHPWGQVPSSPGWYPKGRTRANHILLRLVRELTAT